MCRHLVLIVSIALLAACSSGNEAGARFDASPAPVTDTGAAVDIPTEMGAPDIPRPVLCSLFERSCEGVCTDLGVDRAHCGGCGRACPVGEVCFVGNCQERCPEGQILCRGRCVDPAFDTSHCGGCGALCGEGQVCNRGTCGPACDGADAGVVECRVVEGVRYCADTRRDRRNCGACGTLCPLGQTCIEATCQIACPNGQTRCDAACVNTANDPSHCGACGGRCPTGRVCSGGACRLECASPLIACGEGAALRCVDPLVDASNCGACGVACPSGLSCVAGSCALVCPAGQLTCGGQCRDTQSDDRHCGACENACASGSSCVRGRCEPVCPAGQTACGAACRDLSSEVGHCGACETACPDVANARATCAEGRCGYVCAAGFADCDGRAANGCETDVRDDLAHCGRCGSVCAATDGGVATCVSGRCEVTSTCPSPTREVCDNRDNDCDGAVDNGVTRGCYTGPTGTDGIGACRQGAETCSAGVWSGGCIGQVLPVSEVCDNLDNDCDGATDEGLSRTCYAGPMGTAGVGACRAGTQSCAAGVWGTCVGQVVPRTELCDGLDDDCDGVVDEPFSGQNFQINSLGTTGCRLIDHNGTTGDDRGGIAISTTSVFYTGDSQTGRFPIDLSSQSGTGLVHESLTSNLRTGRVYSLGTGTTALGYGGGTVNSLIELDGTTGAPTSTVINLSTSISVGSGSGIFAGWDRVVIHNGSRVYSIAVPSGTVTDVGAVAAPPHAGCENWAYWGVAEHFGGQLYLDYVQSSTTIARMAVPSGAITTLATFSSLSDMCSFTVSPTTNRWYFHHEGGSQFGGSAETIGYCTASFSVGTNTGPGLGDRCSVGVGACARTGTVICGASGASSVVAGFRHTCVPLTNGTARCWGYNGYGQLGDGTTTDRLATTPVSGITAAVQMAGGQYHTCARLADGTARCWGYNGYGQLGDGTTAQRTTPVTVSGLTGVTQIEAGVYHTCAMRNDGTVRCWGYNGYGQLGDGSYSTRHTPVAVSGLNNAVHIAAGRYHTCAVIADGTVRCWGYNLYGNLGNGTATDSPTPVTVSGLTGVVRITAGYYHTCAIRNDGTAWCWGYNVYGQLGNASTSTSYIPVQVSGLTAAVAITAGYYHTCATRTDNTVRCWGYNNSGQLGDGTTSNRPTPVAVSGISTATQLSAWYYQTCARLADESVRCWGENNYGQLGDETTIDRTTPVTVVGLSEGTTCSAVAGSPSAETCNNIDDNCNGVIDDGLSCP